MKKQTPARDRGLSDAVVTLANHNHFTPKLTGLQSVSIFYLHRAITALAQLRLPRLNPEGFGKVVEHVDPDRPLQKGAGKAPSSAPKKCNCTARKCNCTYFSRIASHPVAMSRAHRCAKNAKGSEACNYRSPRSRFTLMFLMRVKFEGAKPTAR